MQLTFKSFALASALFASPAHAQSDTPKICQERLIKMVIGFPVGTASDVIARIVADKMSAQLGQTIVIENKFGADGELAFNAVAAAAPNGCVMAGLPDGTMATRPAVCAAREGKPTYDPGILTPVGMAAEIPLVILVTKDLPVQTLRELIEYTKHHPNTVNVSYQHPSAKLGNAELMALGADLNEIPYRGEPAAIQDLLGGRIQAMFATVYNARSLIAAGSVRVLAVIGSRRSASMPDVPTTTEEGFPSIGKFPAWTGIFLPPNAPPETVAVFSRALRNVLQDGHVTKKMTELGIPANWKPPEELGTIARDQYSAMETYIRGAHLAEGEKGMACR